MQILITGGAGFIGTHISKLLLDQGHKVLIFDNLSRSDMKFLDKRSLFIEGDVSDNTRLKKSLQGIDSVIHLAQLLDVEESVREPKLYLENNVLGTLNLLECMKDVGVKKIIFSSSACVYGEPEKLPLEEDAVLAPANPYGACKAAVEALLSVYHQQYGFDSVILRYFNPYGPMENHLPETHAIPKFIKAALAKKKIPLYWKGSQIRDFIYIEDLGERSGDVPANFASSAKFKKATGWKPKYTLRQGLEKTIEWFKNQA